MLTTARRETAWRWTVVAFAFLMLGMGWVTDDQVKLRFLGGIALGDVALAVALVSTMRADPPAWAHPWRGGGINRLVAFLLLMFALNAARNISEGASALLVIRNSRRLAAYALFFCVAAAIRSSDDVNRALRVMITLFLIGAASYFAASVTGIPFGGKIEEAFTPSGEPFDRVYHLIFAMATVTGLIAAALLLVQAPAPHRLPTAAVFLIASAIVYLSYFRNYMITYLFGLGVMALLATGADPRAWLRRLPSLLGILVVAWVLALVTGVWDRATERLLTLIAEVAGQDGTVGSRLIIWSIRLGSVLEANPWLGTGFVWDVDPTRTTEEVILDPLVPDNDNGYAAALVLLGFVGVVLWVLLQIAVLRTAWRGWRVARDPVLRAVLLAAVGFVPYVLVSNVGLDNFHWPYAVLPNMLLLGMARGAAALSLQDEGERA